MPTPTVTPTPTATPSPTPTPTPTPVLDAPIELRPAEIAVGRDLVFPMEIWTNLDEDQSVTGAEVHVDFDAAFLEVVDANYGTPRSSIETDSQNLSIVLSGQNVVDNQAGHIDYTALANPNAPFPTGAFRVATIYFKGKQETPAENATEVTFSFSGGRKTGVDFGGDLVAGQHGNAIVNILDELPLIGQLALQGGSRLDSGWQVPVTVRFIGAGAAFTAQILTATTEVDQVDPQTGDPILARFTVSPIPSGTYDIAIKSEHTLTSIKRNVDVTYMRVNVDFGTLLEGDANDDGRISIHDFGLLVGSFGKTTGAAEFDPRADFDRNGGVNISDFGLLAVNFGKQSLIEVP